MQTNTASLSWILVAAAVTSSIGGDLVHADEGRFPLNGPIIIAAPGGYVLTRDIVTDGGPAIDIRAGGVHVDLNGMTLTSTDAASPVIKIAPAVSDGFGVSLSDGRLVGGLHGVEIVGIGAGIVELDRLWIEAPAMHGIAIGDIADIAVSDSVIFSPGGYGIRHLSLAPALTARVFGTRVESPGDTGVSLDGLSSAVLAGNAIRGAGLHGIHVVAGGSCTVIDNLVRDSIDASAAGISVQCGGARVEGNVASANAGNGIETRLSAGGQVVRGNLAAANGGDGFGDFGPNTLLELNQAAANGLHGLMGHNDSDPAMARDNLCRGNGSGSIGESAPGAIEDRGGNICDGACP